MTEPMRAYLMELFERYVEKGLQFVSKHCIQAMAQVDISKVTTLCYLLEALLFSKHTPSLKMVQSISSQLKFLMSTLMSLACSITLVCLLVCSSLTKSYNIKVKSKVCMPVYRTLLS